MEESDLQHSDASKRRAHVKRGAKPSWCTLLMRWEQNSAVGMEEVLQNFTKPDNLVVYPCVETFSVAKAFLLLPKHRNISGYKVDPSSVNAKMRRISLAYDQPVLSGGRTSIEMSRFVLLPVCASRESGRLRFVSV